MESAPSSGSSSVSQEFQQAKSSINERQVDGSETQTQDAPAQLESYSPRYNNYAELRGYQPEQTSTVEQPVEQTLGPDRPDRIRQPDFAQPHSGGVVANDIAAFHNASMLNEGRQMPPVEVSQPPLDRDAANQKAHDQAMAQNERYAEERAMEKKERLAQLQNMRECDLDQGREL